MSDSPPRRVPRGPALASTDAELDAAAAITPEDLDRAIVAWKRNAPPEAANLLDAEPEPPDDGRA